MKTLKQKLSVLLVLSGLTALVALFLMPLEDELEESGTHSKKQSKSAGLLPIELKERANVTGTGNLSKSVTPETSQRVVEKGERDSGTYRIIGRVVDSKGQGLSGVEIRFFKERKEIVFEDLEDIPDMKEEASEVIKSRQDGEFYFEKLTKPEFGLLEFAGSPRFLIKSMGMPSFEDNKRLLDLGDIQLKDGLVIRGQVLDPEGVGIPGAIVNCEKQVVVNPVKKFRVKFGKNLDWNDLVVPTDFSFVVGRTRVVSDELGNFVIGHLEPGNYELSATLKNYRASERKIVQLIKGEGSKQTLRLRDLVTFQVTVRDHQGRALEGASVRLRDRLGSTSTSTVRPKSLSNKRGQVSYERLSFDSGLLTIEKSGYSKVFDSIQFSSEAWQGKTYVLWPEVTVIGKVLSNKTGKGLAARISMVLKGEGTGLSFEGLTDDSGAFRIGELAPGLYSITVVGTRHVVERRELLIPEGKKTVSLPPMSLEPLVTVEFLVLDSAGKPVNDARVRASKVGFEMLPMVSGDKIISPGYLTSSTDEQGKLTLNTVAPGTVSFSAEKEGLPTAYAESIIVSDSGTKVTLRFLKTGAELIGYGFNSVGQKLKGVEVALLRRGFRRIEQTVSFKGDGSYSVSNLAPGFYKFVSFKDDPKTVFESSGWFEVRSGTVTTWDYYESN